MKKKYHTMREIEETFFPNLAKEKDKKEKQRLIDLWGKDLAERILKMRNRNKEQTNADKK